MRRLRFTTRCGMAWVLVVAVLLTWGLQGRRMAPAYRQRALSYTSKEYNQRLGLLRLSTARDRRAVGPGPVAGVDRPEGDTARAIASSWRKTEYFRRMRRKYEWAASWPWLPVLPDPPEPESGAPAAGRLPPLRVRRRAGRGSRGDTSRR